MIDLQNLQKPIVMGILNVTPDSFYDGGKYSNAIEIELRIQQIITDGASIIDIGAYSSKPGAKHISQNEELQRLIPAIKIIKRIAPDFSISIDSFRSEIAEIIYKEFGTIIINDISGGEIDKQMMKICATYSLPYICMHMQGTPQSMQNKPMYSDVCKEIYNFLETKINTASKYGIQNIVIDPGFGFGKSIEHNFELLKNLDTFLTLNKPILVGLSRKSMIYKALNCTAEEALNGSTVLHTIAIKNGAKIIRAHDVKAAVEVVELTNIINLKNQF